MKQEELERNKEYYRVECNKYDALKCKLTNQRCDGLCKAMREYTVVVDKLQLMPKNNEVDERIADIVAKVVTEHYAMPITILSANIRHKPSMIYFATICKMLELNKSCFAQRLAFSLGKMSTIANSHIALLREEKSERVKFYVVYRKVILALNKYLKNK